MLSIPTKPRSGQRPKRRRPRTVIARWIRARRSTGNGLCSRRPSRHRGLATQDGFLLIEVIVSSLIVAVVVVATLTGFDVVNRTTADERRHNQAAVLAAQSQEQMRTLPAGTLSALESSPHTYTRVVGGTTYSITQEAKATNASQSSTGCSVSNTTAQTAANVQITSSVTWPTLGTRSPVRESSIITPPTGSALEVDVGNAPAPTAGVAGVTVIVKYTSILTHTPGTLEATTNSSGCLVFGGIPATSAIVEIPEKLRFVTPSGALKIAPKEFTITPNTTTHDAVTYNEGGRIAAEFTYKGAGEWEGLKVKSDTFVAFNVAIPAAPEFELGSTSFQYEAGGEEHYKALTGSFGTAAMTPAGLKYLSGDLFPFPSPGAWSVYAGDCTKNNPSAIKEVELPSGVYVEPGKTTTVKVPMSHVTLNVYSGTQSSKGALEAVSYPVKITNTECEGAPVPNNASAAPIIEHNQASTSAGHLENPFQPFGKAKLCVFNKAVGKAYTVNYNNNSIAGSTANVYIGERSEAEKVEQRQKEETAAKTKREGEETAARTKREGEEATTRKNAEKVEETARIKREGEETAKRIEAENKEKEGKLPAAYSAATEYALNARVSESGKLYQSIKAANKGHTPKTNATWWKTVTRAEVESKRKSEEATTRTNAEKVEETAKIKREGEEATTRKAAEKAEEAPRIKREGEEATLKTQREKEEAEEAAKKEAIVESGRGSC